MKTKRTIVRRGLVILSAVTWSAVNAHAQGNPCIESGPAYAAWHCFQAGTLDSPGTLNQTAINVFVNQTVVPPVLLTSPTFFNGQKRRWLTYDCVPPAVDHYEMAGVRYEARNLNFQRVNGSSPASIAGPYPTPGAHQYTAYVDGTPLSLAGWWPAEGNGNDVVFGNTGTFPSGIAYAPGKVGLAFDFDGSARHVSIPDNPNFKLVGSLTVEAWIYPRQTGGIIMSRGDNRAGLNPWQLDLSNLQNVLFSLVNANNQGAAIMAPIQLNQWQHVAATWEGMTGLLKLYINGNVVAQSVSSVKVLLDLDPTQQPAVVIGKQGGISSQAPYNGMIDEPSIYSCALTQAEIQSIYNAGMAGKHRDGSEPGAVDAPVACGTCVAIPTVIGTVTVNVFGLTDSDGDGLSDDWEMFYFGNLAQTGTGNPDADGLTNLQEYQLGLNPTVDQSAQSGSRRNYIYDRLDRLDDVTGVGQVNFTLDKEGNITTVTP